MTVKRSLILLLLACPALLAWHPLRGRVSEVEQGNEALLEGDAEAALDAYDEAAARVPDSLALQYDRGLALLELDRFDEAAQALGRAVHAVDPKLRFRAFFALGVLRYGQEDWQGAVDAFQSALRLRPEDDEVRLNFELAWLELHPPCRLREDPFEENDSVHEAALLEKPPEEPLRACPGDEDWFAIDAPSGAALFVTLKVLGEEARMRLALLGPSGDLLQEALGSKELGVDLRLTREAGRYRFCVSVQDEQSEPAYELGVEVVAPCPAGEDGLEENDGPEQARQVAKGEQKGLRICPGDEDWFEVPLKEGESLAATIQFPPGRGPLQVELYADQVGLIAAGSGRDGQMMAFFEKGFSEQGSVMVRIMGVLQGVDNRYDLSLADEPPEEDGEPGDEEQQEEKEEEEKEKEKEKEEEEEEEEEEKEKEKEQQEQEKEQPPPDPAEMMDHQMKSVLDALQEEDRNVQLEKLLRSLPPQRVEKDW